MANTISLKAERKRVYKALRNSCEADIECAMCDYDYDWNENLSDEKNLRQLAKAIVYDKK